MKRTYTIKSRNPILDGTLVTITGKCLAEILCKADRIAAKPETKGLIPLKKGVPA